MPSTRSEPVRRALQSIRHNIELAREFVAGQSFESFQSDQKTIYAVTRCLEIISESSRRLPDDLLVRHPGVPWANIKAAGNIYRHEYDNVSSRMLWATILNALDDLDVIAKAELALLKPPTEAENGQ